MLANDGAPGCLPVTSSSPGTACACRSATRDFGSACRARGDKFYVPDVETQQVALLGTAIENTRNRGAIDGQGDLVAIAVRRKIVGNLMTEVEQLAIRPDRPFAHGWRKRSWRWCRRRRVGGAHACGAAAPAAGGGDEAQLRPRLQVRLRPPVRVAPAERHPPLAWTWGGSRRLPADRRSGGSDEGAASERLRRVGAILHRAPYGMPSGGNTFEQAMSDSIHSVR
jgi:hypothetical protein